MMINFLIIVSLSVNVLSYYLYQKINGSLAKQTAILEKYERQKNNLKGQLMVSTLTDNIMLPSTEQLID